MSKARDFVENMRGVSSNIQTQLSNKRGTGTDVAVTDGGTGASTAGAARTALGLAIDSDVQAHDADTAKLDANANFTGTLQRGGTDVLVTGDVTNANFTGADLEIAKGGTGASSAGAARTALGVAIGTDVLAPDGSAANLTNLPAGGAEDFVASGTLPNGKPVILNSNGTVTAAGFVPTAVSQAIPEGALSVFNAGGCDELVSISFDPNTQGKFVVAWKEGGVGQLCIGTRVGSSLTFGTEVVFASSVTTYIQVAYDPNNANKFAINYGIGGNGYGTCRIGVVSGTSVTLGSAVTWASGEVQQVRFAFDPSTNNKFVVCARNEGNSNKGEAYVGTISGSSVSFGSAVIFNNGGTSSLDVSFDAQTANKFIVCCRADDDSSKGKALVGSVSGTSISFGTAVEFSSSTAAYVRCDFDPNTASKFIVTYREDSAIASLIKVGTVSGTSVSFNSAVTWESIDATSGGYYDISWDKNTATKFIINYKNGTTQGKVALGTFNGTSVSFATSAVYLDAGITNSSSSFDSEAGVFVVVFSKRTAGGGTAGTFHGAAISSQIAATKSLTNLTATNFLGTATAAYTDGQTASIMLKGGISDNQTSLTAGSSYYVQTNGTFSTTAGTPSVLAGEAVSATSLLLNALPRPVEISSGNLVLLGTVTADEVSNVIISGLFSSTYDVYKVFASDVQGKGSNQPLQLQYGPSDYFFDSSYEFTSTFIASNSAAYAGISHNGTTHMQILQAMGDRVSTYLTDKSYSEITIFKPLSTDHETVVMWNGVSKMSTVKYMAGAGCRENTTVAITRLRFKSTDDFHGVFKIYGVVK